MALTHFDMVGGTGIILGIPPHELPRNAWSDGRNVRMINGAIHKSTGEIAVWGTPPIVPYWGMAAPTTTQYFWIYAGLNKVYATDGSIHYNITRQSTGVDVDYNATEAHSWNGGVIGGIPVINNGVDDPQMWVPVSSGQRLQMLTAWPANTKAAIVRPFRNYLVALDITKSSTRYPRMLKWSHPADPGATPASWDHTDPTKDAGEFELSETSDFLVDCMTLRDINVIYKENTTWGMQFIGGPYVFRFFKMFGESGLLTKNCAREFLGRHLVVTRGDIIVHDGQQSKSIFPEGTIKKMADAVFSAIDPSAYTKCHLIMDYASKEAWFAYPEVGASFCTQALIWNWKEGTFGKRDLPNTSYAMTGTYSPDSTVWDTDSAVWDVDTTAWDSRPFNPSRDNVLLISPYNNRIYSANDTEQFDTANMTSYIERSGIRLFQMRDGGPPPSAQSDWYLVKQVWPKIRATGEVSVFVGKQDSINDAVTWVGPYTFNPNTQLYFSCYVNTIFPAIKIVSNTDISWQVDGFALDIERTSSY